MAFRVRGWTNKIFGGNRPGTAGNIGWVGRILITVVNSASLTTAINLASNVAVLASSLAANLSIPKPLAASIAAISSVVASGLTTSIALAGNLSVNAIVTLANLTTSGGAGNPSLSFSTAQNSEYLVMGFI